MIPTNEVVLDDNNSAEMDEKRRILFERMKQRQEERLSKRGKDSQEHNPATFWKLFNELIEQQKTAHELQLFLNQHIHYLPNYDVRKADEKIKKIQEESKKEKKKFAFKKKTPSTNSLSESNSDSPSTTSSSDASPSFKLPETNKTVIDLSTFDTEEIRTIEPTRENESFSICNGDNQTLYIKNIIGAVYISNLNNCNILLGPVRGAVFLSKATNCTFQLACWQLRIHDSTNCQFFICPKNNPIIENCSSLKFGKYSLTYEGMEEQFKLSDMDVNDDSKNKWNKVHDFNWLKTNEPSPNFEYI